jgi:hypothetical protein
MKAIIVLAFSGLLSSTCLMANARADTPTVVQYNLVGVTLADGGSITGSFDWDYGPGVYEFTDINIVATGGGAELGEVVAVTNGTDVLNPGGECLSINTTTEFGCSPLTLPGILINFVTRLGPNAVFPNEPVQSVVTICTAAADNCGLATGYDGIVTVPSQVLFPGTDPDVTGGELVATAPEPGTLILASWGTLGLGLMLGLKRLRSSKNLPRDLKRSRHAHQ